MDNSKINDLATNLFKTVKGYVQESFSNISKRIDILEENIKNQPLPLKGDKGDKGEDGSSVDSDLLIAKLESKVKTLVSEIPVIHGKNGVDGKDGKDGTNGKGVTVEELTPVIQSLIKALPLPEPIKGADGKNGKDAEVDYEFVIDSVKTELINNETIISKIVNAIPVPSNGVDGKDGVDGKSITVEEVAPTINNLIDEKIKSIKVVDGKDGKDGKDGVDGKDGKDAEPFEQSYVEEIVKHVLSEMDLPIVQGIDGKDGVNGKDGEPADENKILRLLYDNIKNSPSILKEIASYVSLPDVINGKDGVDGKDGKDGTNGKDSLEIEILDLIDSDKQYSRNTYANYNGGLVRSFKLTEPLSKALGLEKSGWHVIVNGIKSSDAELKDDNTIVFKTEFTNGELIEKEMNIPYMVYRGVWQDGLYTKNETTTWSGSLWICTTKETNTKPGEGSDWQLAVKKGRDGRDGLKGDKGDRGAQGRDGKDLTQMDFNGRKF